MSRVWRIVILALAVATVVATFLVLRPGDDSDEERAISRPPTSQVPPTASPDPASRSRPRRRRPSPTPESPTARIRVRDGQPVGGVEEISVRNGDRVRIAVSSDVADEMHLHGYDLSVATRPGRVASLRFRADLEGVFEIELEERAVPIAELKVRP